MNHINEARTKILPVLCCHFEIVDGGIFERTKPTGPFAWPQHVLEPIRLAHI